MSTTNPSAIHPIPYLSFDGTCADAMRFYETALNGKILSMMSGSQAPDSEPMAQSFGDRILNAQLQLPGGSFIYAGDCPTHMPYAGIHGIGIALNFNTSEEGEEVFNRLADGGKVNMPFAPTFWAEKFGMVTDKFGVDWLINGPLLHM